MRKLHPHTFARLEGQRRHAGRAGTLLLAAALGALLAPSVARALSFPLDVRFSTGAVGHYASVDVSEKKGALDFTIRLDESLGPKADLHLFYFNLVGKFSGLSVESGDKVTTPYALRTKTCLVRDACSLFDFAVDFGSGSSAKGNGVLKQASFTLLADQPLAIADLLEASTVGKKIVVNVAANVEGTGLRDPKHDGKPHRNYGDDDSDGNSDDSDGWVRDDKDGWGHDDSDYKDDFKHKQPRSETVGGLVPEPSVALLLGGGLAGLAFLGRRRRL